MTQNLNEIKLASQLVEATERTPNPFDPAAIRMDQAFVETACVEKLLTIVRFGSRVPRNSSAFILTWSTA
jgi:hypothetical protein